MKKLIKISLSFFLLLALALIAFALYRQLTSPKVVLKEGNNINPIISSDRRFMLELEEKYPDLTKQLDRSESAKGTYVIPCLKQSQSLKQTKNGNRAVLANDMVPQGLAILNEDYLVISAYSKSKKFNSVLWLIERKTGKFIKTIVLENKEHLGAIAYDNDNQVLWIATIGNHSVAQVQALTLKQIKNYDFKDSNQSISFSKTEHLKGIKETSYMSYHQGKLYIGYFKLKGQGKLAVFSIDKEGQLLKSKEKLAKPVRVLDTYSDIQGISFYKDSIFMTQSYGLNKSKLIIFDNKLSDPKFQLNKGQIESQLKLPPYLEQALGYEGKIYLLFESGSMKYRLNPLLFNLDRVLILNGDGIINP